MIVKIKDLVQEKRCKNCGKKFLAAKVPRKHYSLSLRRHDAVNCSHKCANDWIYNRLKLKRMKGGRN